MKRILSIVLALLMICTLVSCSDEKEKVTEEKKKGEDLSALTAEELYLYGINKMKALKSALYTTKVLEGAEELGEFETVRIREGYEGYRYSRRGQGFYAYDGETAYTRDESGAYSAPATMRVFDEFLTQYVFPVCALNAELIENLQREGDTVRYESRSEALLALYRLAEKPDFIPTSISGVATFDEEGVIQEERITLKGEEEEVELHTVLSSYRSDSITVATPSNLEEFTEVTDIRLPRRLQDSILSLYEQSEVQTTIVSSATLKLGETKYVYSEDVNTYAKTEEEAYYLSKQTLKQIPELPEESIFYQALLTKGTKVENRYNVILGEKLWENTQAAKDLPWQDEVRSLIPALSDFATLSMTEEVGGYSIAFTLTDEAAKRIAGEAMELFPEGGVVFNAATVRACTGTVSIDRERGILTAITYSVEGGFTCEGGVGDYECRYSVLVDRTEDVTLPELQTPTATTPGMITDEIHDAVC